MLETILLIILIIISGLLTQRGGFCLVAAVEEIAKSRFFKITNILAVALISGAILMISHPPYSFHPNQQQFIIAIVGAIIFGFGATVNNACFFGTLTQFFKGNSNMLFTLIGIISASIFIPPFATGQNTPPTYPSFIGYSLVLFIILSLFICLDYKKKYYDFIWLLIPSITFGFINTSTFGWSLSQLIINIWYFIYSDSQFIALQMWEFVAFLLGMWLYHFRYSQFEWKRFNYAIAIKNFIAGTIMVLGARMMGGGNDTLLFARLPTLVPEIFTLLFVLILSIYFSRGLIDKLNFKLN